MSLYQNILDISSFKNCCFPCRRIKTSGKRDSNPRPQPWQGCALPTELFPQQKECEEEETRTPTSQLTLPPQSSASTNSATSPTSTMLNKKECPEQDSNLHTSRHTHLKRARLPIPPPGHKTVETNFQHSFLFNM